MVQEGSNLFMVEIYELVQNFLVVVYDKLELLVTQNEKNLF